MTTEDESLLAWEKQCGVQHGVPFFPTSRSWNDYNRLGPGLGVCLPVSPASRIEGSCILTQIVTGKLPCLGFWERIHELTSKYCIYIQLPCGKTQSDSWKPCHVENWQPMPGLCLAYAVKSRGLYSVSLWLQCPRKRDRKERKKEGRKEGRKLSLSLPNQGFSNGTPCPKQHLSVFSVAAWHVAALFISAIASKRASNHWSVCWDEMKSLAFFESDRNPCSLVYVAARLLPRTWKPLQPLADPVAMAAATEVSTRSWR